jgi:copper(I)-binding protein
MNRLRGLIVVAAALAVTGCVAVSSDTAAPTVDPCAASVAAYNGVVAGSFVTTVGAIRRLDEPQQIEPQRWPGLPDSHPAVLCYIDGQIPKGPPPPISGTIPPSFDRAVIAVVDGQSDLIMAGYRDNLPVVAPAAVSETSASPPSHGSGMNIIDAQAMPIPGNGNPVIVVATIRNGTGRDDKLVGGSSPVATTVGLYSTCACATPEPTDPVTGIEGIAPFPWWLIRADETIQLRAGAGEMVLSGLSQPLAAGQTVEVTFEFAYADPVTVQIPVVSAG